MKISDLMQDRKETGRDCVACAVNYISVFHKSLFRTVQLRFHPLSAGRVQEKNPVVKVQSSYTRSPEVILYFYMKTRYN